jgi:NADH:ubiquinone oxidoreductase subunit K
MSQVEAEWHAMAGGDPAVGQIFTLFIMGIAAAEAAIGVSVILAVYRRYQTSDPEKVDDLHG